MKIMKIKYLPLLLLGASLTACNDFLDKEPESLVTPKAYFGSEADLAAYASIYIILRALIPAVTESVSSLMTMARIIKHL